MSVLSIIIPCYNEENNILIILDKIKNVILPFNIKKEIVIIDDYSTDKTRKILNSLDKSNYKIIFQDQNYGKWYAVRTGIKHSTWDYIIIQDADLEYDPWDYIILLNTIIMEDLPVVYGSRRLQNKQLYSSRIHYIGANITTYITNFLYKSSLTDANTCYKLFRKASILWNSFSAQRFEFDQELTWFFLKKYNFIKEIPINYYPRSTQEGKKINIYDFFHAIDNILKFRFWLKKHNRTSFKILCIFVWWIACFIWSLQFLMMVWFYQIHNYRSIAIAFIILHAILYRWITFGLFSSKRLSLWIIIKRYIINISLLLFFYFFWVFYFVKIAQWVWLYQGLFFLFNSILLVSWSIFLHNFIKDLQSMD